MNDHNIKWLQLPFLSLFPTTISLSPCAVKESGISKSSGSFSLVLKYLMSEQETLEIAHDQTAIQGIYIGLSDKNRN